MCHDGGTLWECDTAGCYRAVCDRCVEMPSSAVEISRRSSVKFTCPSCHWNWRTPAGPYYVSTLSISFCSHANVFETFLQGFTLNGKPVLNTFLTVNGAFQQSISARILTPPTILLHFYLESISHTAHFTLTENLVGEYYSSEDKLEVCNLPFNIRDERGVATWNKEASKLVAGLSGYSHVIVFITTHSVPTNGDLWIGKDNDNEGIAVTVDNVSIIYFIISYWYLPRT
jgi:hypothetical protein